MDEVQNINNYDQKFDNWLKSNSNLNKDLEKIRQNQIKRQYRFYKFQYLLQIPLFLGAAFLPWFRFVKDVSDLVIIDAGAMQMNIWIWGLLSLGAILSIGTSLYLKWYPPQMNKFQWINFSFAILLIPILFSFIDPVFAPGLGGRHEEAIGIKLLSFLGYSVWPQIGYFFVIGVFILVSIGFVLSILWK
ncbi:MAG: hypothetical protein ACFE95_14705 [Candidatus Hodarchaeota archaeon]